MATIRLVPSAYTRSSTSRVTVSDETNMYHNTDNTSNYATLRGRNNSSSTYYVFIHGFNFNDIPLIEELLDKNDEYYLQAHHQAIP